MKFHVILPSPETSLFAPMSKQTTLFQTWTTSDKSSNGMAKQGEIKITEEQDTLIQAIPHYLNHRYISDKTVMGDISGFDGYTRPTTLFEPTDQFKSGFIRTQWCAYPHTGGRSSIKPAQFLYKLQWKLQSNQNAISMLAIIV